MILCAQSCKLKEYPEAREISFVGGVLVAVTNIYVALGEFGAKKGI